jgi:hypothetical protein
MSKCLWNVPLKLVNSVTCISLLKRWRGQNGTQCAQCNLQLSGLCPFGAFDLSPENAMNPLKIRSWVLYRPGLQGSGAQDTRGANPVRPGPRSRGWVGVGACSSRGPHAQHGLLCAAGLSGVAALALPLPPLPPPRTPPPAAQGLPGNGVPGCRPPKEPRHRYNALTGRTGRRLSGRGARTCRRPDPSPRRREPYRGRTRPMSRAAATTGTHQSEGGPGGLQLPLAHGPDSGPDQRGRHRRRPGARCLGPELRHLNLSPWTQRAH